MDKEEQSLVHEQLEKLQERDWKTLSLDEKKAGMFTYNILLNAQWMFIIVFSCRKAYYVAFGPHGPRAPLHPPGSVLKIFLGTAGLVGLAGVLFLTIRHFCEFSTSIVHFHRF